MHIKSSLAIEVPVATITVGHCVRYVDKSQSTLYILVYDSESRSRM